MMLICLRQPPFADLGAGGKNRIMALGFRLNECLRFLVEHLRFGISGLGLGWVEGFLSHQGPIKAPP